MTKACSLTFIFVFLSVSFAWSQKEDFQNLENHEEIKEPGFELVTSGLIMHTPTERVTDLAAEIHLTYWFSHIWAFGLGYTQVFEENGRVGHEIAVLASTKPWKFLTVNFGPSILLPNSQSDTEFSAYIEGEFNFELGGFHTGPLIGTLIGNELRVFSGIHLGYDF